MAKYVNHNRQPTEEGREITDYMDGICQEHLKQRDLGQINNLAGHYIHYLANVVQMKTITREQWLEQFENSGAANAQRDMVFLREQADAITEAAEPDSDLVKKLGLVQEQLKSQKKKNAALRKKNARLVKEQVEAEDIDAEDELDVEDEPDEEPAEEDGEGKSED